MLITLLLLTLPLAAAQIENLKEIDSVNLKFTTTGTLKTEGNTRYTYLKLYAFPKTDYYSIVSRIDTEPLAELRTAEVPNYYYYTWDADLIQREADTLEQKLSKSSLDYSLTAYINSRFVLPKVTEKSKFPYAPLKIAIKPYIEATDKIDSNNTEIKRLANNLAEGESDAYKIAFKFARYISSIMTYDTDFLEGTQKASWVLENKKGVCDEYVVLFMALSRSVGIPVRYVSGVAFSNVDDDFIPHSWAEVWLPDAGWIPFDPTYNEFGWVDSTHIKMQETQDVEVSVIKYIWEIGDVEGEQPDIRVTMSDKEVGLSNYLTTKIWVEKSEVGFGSYNIVWMKLENPADYYIIPEVALDKAPQVIGDNHQYIFLEPHSSELIHWIVKIPYDLDKKYSYTYSVESNALFAAEKNVSFVAKSNSESLTLADINKKLQTNISETAKAQPELKISIYRPAKAHLNKPFEIEVTAANEGNAAIPNLKICADDCQTTYLGISEEVTRIFTLTRELEGENKIRLTFIGEGVDITQEITVLVRKQNILEMIIERVRRLFGA